MYPTWNIQIVKNSVSDLNGEMGVFIGVHPTQHIQHKPFGTLALGVEMRNNSITAHIPNVIARVDDNFPNGYLNYLEFHKLEHNYVDEGIPAILGSIIQNNSATNCENAVYLNSGTYNAVVCNTRLVNTAHGIKDKTLQGLNHASVQTTTCADGTTGQLPLADPKTNLPILSSAGLTRLLPLTGSTHRGEITAFTISKLPSVTSGILYINETPVAKDTVVSSDQAAFVSFYPSLNYTGTVSFAYCSIDDQSNRSLPATFSIPIISPPSVQQMHFAVEGDSANAFLHWEIASKTNVKYFTVQRSLEGIHFTAVGRINVRDSITSVKTTYDYQDIGIGTTSQGSIYYRLEQFNTDGSIQHSYARSIYFLTKNAPKVNIYPNPTDNNLYVGLSAPRRNLKFIR
ncbi:hypothetical protein [Hymenobacter radiodurans]|uniref:hypothetical protein n=1 Tax=Hymenobacter radiodurans TaxID=2496028 RepID=UPI0010591742|nr:hypothetical protein [Hymenobacter radiodurans]